MAKRKKYRVTAENSEAFACSLVTNPAVEELFVSFSEDKQIVEKLADNAKHMVTGIVAIPEKPLYRNKNGEEYDIVFSADAIESMAKKFMKNFRQMNVTLQHQEDATGIYMVEQWIKTDQEHDKSIALGFSSDIPNGTWFQTYYVDSNDVWDRITSGELRGFSLECVLGVEEIEEQIFEEQAPSQEAEPVAEQPAPKSEKGILGKILDLINGADIKDVVNTHEDETILTPEQSNEGADEGSITVEDNGEVTVEETVKEETVEAQPEQPNPLEEVVKNLRAEIEELKKNNEALINKIGEISKEPSAKPVNTNAGNGGAVVEGINNPAYQNWRDKIRGAM